jgi:surface protein
VCDSGCGVTLVMAWMVRCVRVHARMMRVGMICPGVFLSAVFYAASAFNGDLSAWNVESAVTNMQGSAPHAISAQAHMSSPHWFLGGDLQSAGLAMCGGRSRVCDNGGGVTVVEAWMVCGACVHARMMGVGMMRRGFLPFGSVPRRSGFQRRPLGVGCERRDQHAF